MNPYLGVSNERPQQKEYRQNPKSPIDVIEYIERVLKYGVRTSLLNSQEKMEVEIIKVSAGVLTQEQTFNYLLMVEELFST